MPSMVASFDWAEQPERCFPTVPRNSAKRLLDEHRARSFFLPPSSISICAAIRLR